MEVKVGVLILMALGLLVGFMVVMGGLSFRPQTTLYIDFENPGALQSGAPVRLAGIKVGRIADIQFRGGQKDPATQQPVAPIRVVARVESEYARAIHTDARWYVTTQGVLGEPFLAVEPGSPGKPLVTEGAVAQGVNPPRLDLLLSEGYELLHKTYQGITNNEQKLTETFDGLHATLKGTGDFLSHNRAQLDKIVTNTENLTGEARQTVKEARERFVSGPQVNRIMNNVERTTEGLPPLVEDGRQVLADAKRVTAALGSEDQVRRYQQITKDLGDTSSRAKLAITDAQGLMAHIKSGKGTAGALAMDETVYDDLQELLRDLRHNPWKLFWKQ